jgi:hypothetical protein
MTEASRHGTKQKRPGENRGVLYIGERATKKKDESRLNPS